MKLISLFEEQRTIEGDVILPTETTELRHAGYIVDGDYDCANSHITSLRGAPRQVGKGFYCYNTRIISLEGGPVRVEKDYDCSNTKITSFAGAPRYVGGDFISYNTKLQFLEGAPEYVGSDFLFYDNNAIISLHNIHKHIKHIGAGIHLPGTIKSNILGLMLIKGLKYITIYSVTPRFKKAEIILSGHLRGDRNPHDCQEELIEAGLAEFAKL